jgi:isopentenyldiphosphate isomerase
MADHLVDVVNTQDEIIGQDLKSNKIAKDFISRVVAILLLNNNRDIILCKRADHKKNAAGLYDLAAFGNVEADESYEAAAHRELQEELGIKCDLKLLDKFYQEVENDDKKYKIFCAVFLGQTGEMLTLNHELVEVKTMSLLDFQNELQINPQNYCPGLINDYQHCKDKL